MRAFPVPETMDEVLISNLSNISHAGLLLDRLAPYPDDSFRVFDQQNQKEHIERVAQASTRGDSKLLNGWIDMVRALPTTVAWQQRTVWRLAGQLSRATTLENGGVPLHPIYGFAYLTGSGLKGLARAWAQQNHNSEQDIQRVFGSVDVVQEDESLETAWSAEAGTVVFLESWPAAWPRLECDIVNNHHRKYYKEAGVGAPPGDWESPNPTYFLAVPQNTVFRFALAQRNQIELPAKSDVELAAGWLQAALQELGAGAKTSAGYGYFSIPEGI